jgi:hypothetical protein
VIAERMKPSGPCFESGPKYYFSFEQAFSPLPKMKLLGVFSGFYEQLEVFDSAGKLWRLQELRCRQKKSRLLRLVVHLFYNPWVDVEYVWAEPRDYTLEKLRSRFLTAIDRDDDILTQFVEPEVLKKKAEAAMSFAELATVYRSSQKDSR